MNNLLMMHINHHCQSIFTSEASWVSSPYSVADVDSKWAFSQISTMNDIKTSDIGLEVVESNIMSDIGLHTLPVFDT